MWKIPDLPFNKLKEKRGDREKEKDRGREEKREGFVS